MQFDSRFIIFIMVGVCSTTNPFAIANDRYCQHADLSGGIVVVGGAGIVVIWAISTLSGTGSKGSPDAPGRL